MRRLRVLLCTIVGLFVLAPAATAGAVSTGGASVPGDLEIGAAVCADGKRWACRQGQKLVLTGSGLSGVKRVEFLGGRGASDNRYARPLGQEEGELRVVVPRGARTGRLRLRSITADPVTTSSPVAISPAARSAAPEVELTETLADGVFPIRGKHDMGQTETNSFGGGRNHKGQDLFAACGTPLVAVRDGVVQFVGEQSRAGHYVVLQDAEGRSYAYMHMKARALVRKDDRVTAGDPVGYVGDTGRATGCHLHFELWTAPGWYTGGRAVDPMPQLRRWEAADRGHR